MGVSFRRLIANLKRNNYSASISRTDGLLNFKFQDTFKKQLKTKAKVKNRTLLSHWPTTTLDIDDSIRGHRRWRGEKGRGGSLATSPPPSTKKRGAVHQRFGAEKSLLRVHLTSHWHYLWHRRLPSDRTFSALRRLNNYLEKHHKAGPPEQLTDALGKSELWLWWFKRGFLVLTNNAMPEWRMSPLPTF